MAAVALFQASFFANASLQVTAPGFETVIAPFSTSSGNWTDNFNTTTGVFDVPETGYYHVTLAGRWSNNGSGSVRAIFVVKNRATNYNAVLGNWMPVIGGYLPTSIAGVVHLQAGDTLEGRIFATLAGGGTNFDRCELTIAKV